MIQIKAAALFICLTLLCSGCSKPIQTTGFPVSVVKTENQDLSPDYGDTIVIALDTVSVVLDPFSNHDPASGVVTDQIFCGLLSKGPDRRFNCDLAETFEIADRSLTFRLKHDVKWHDLENFTSADVLFTYGQVMEMQGTELYDHFSRISTLETPDMYTVIARYREPWPWALNDWTVKILARHVFESKKDTVGYSQLLMGTGPYKLQEFSSGEKITLTAFDQFHGSIPYLGSQIFRFIPDHSGSAAFLALMRHEIDMTELTLDQYLNRTPSDEFMSRYNVYHYTDFKGYYCILYNLDRPFFQDLRLRNALNTALDRKRIAFRIFYESGRLVNGPFIPGDWAENITGEVQRYSTSEASLLLNESGWITEAGGRKKDGQTLSIELCLDPQDEFMPKIAAQVKSDWESVEVAVRINSAEKNIQKLVSRDFDAALVYFKYSDEPDLQSRYWTTDSIPASGNTGENYSGFRNTEVDRLWVLARNTSSMQEREMIFHRIQELIVNQTPATFLFSPDKILAVDRRFFGIRITPGGILYNLDKWYVPKKFQKYIQ
ncbi:MAG: ABC transporter substrate-binding protein [Candidatus Wallbacteria bacterium]|nr:ABC transporter substrate-binding protein [Candidatus Wallbacteria bacterium]